MTKFEILRGVHITAEKTYYPGEIVESDDPLDELHNKPHSIRIRKLPDHEPITAVPNALSSMTVPELKELAEAEEIDLGEATKKADIMAAISVALIGNAVSARSAESEE